MLPYYLSRNIVNVRQLTVGKRFATPNSIISSTPDCDKFGNPINKWFGSDTASSSDSGDSDSGWVPGATTKRSAEPENYKLDWTHRGDCAVDNPPSCISGSDEAADSENEAPKTEAERRWIDPPSTVPTSFGTECSLETCDMCPTFPGCGGGEMKAGEVSAKQNWAQPPIEKRDEPAIEAIGLRGDWKQPPREVKREAYISPIVAGGVNVGVGPECSIYTCDLCPDHPGCEDVEVREPPRH